MFLVYYLLFVNLVALILYGIDKKKAEKGKYRIPESRLLLIAFLGGSIGAWLGILIFHHKTKKKKFSVTVPILATLLILISGFSLYQNYHLITTEYEYLSVDVPLELDGYTIVQVSDLHNQIFGIGQKTLLKKIEECEPDLIVVTGDAVDLTHTNYGPTKTFFKSAVEIAPVYYITGNHEIWLRDRDGEKYQDYIQEIISYGVNYIDDQAVYVDGFKLVGIADDSLSGDISNVFKTEPAEEVTSDLVITLAHEPNYMDKYAATETDLVFSGHNHGGQIKLGDKGMLSADFSFFPEFDSGEFTSGSTTMIVSQGLGNSVLPVRVNDYPEIVKVELKHEEHKIMHLYMPDLVGLTWEEANTKLKGMGFFNIVDEYETNESVEEGRVIRQSIPPETTVSTDYEIILYISE